jgi:4,5-DOPA dioxygenase extradiol
VTVAARSTDVFPAAFFGHGTPVNTIASNRYTQAWRTYGAALPRPGAILVFSAHWYVPGTRITVARRPPTIHDFSLRFPQALFDFTYPAAGDAALVERIVELAAPVHVERDAASWGIDHGAYSVLAHVFPAADVPVVQISLDRAQSPAWHYAFAARFAPLRAEGVFIMGSGNIVHNLELADATLNDQSFPWAGRFDERVRGLLDAGDHAALVDYHRLGPDARLAVPTPDHYLPLLSVLATQRAGERVEPIVDGFGFGAGSMLSLCLAS